MEPVKATRLSDFITLPNAEEGFVAAVTASANASGVDLRTIGPTTPNQAIEGQETGKGVCDHYITIQADGADVWIVSGASQASVTGANAPSSTAAGKGVIGTPFVGLCFKVGKETERSFLPTQDRPWLNFIGGGAGFIRIFKTSK